ASSRPSGHGCPHGAAVRAWREAAEPNAAAAVVSHPAESLCRRLVVDRELSGARSGPPGDHAVRAAPGTAPRPLPARPTPDIAAADRGLACPARPGPRGLLPAGRRARADGAVRLHAHERTRGHDCGRTV